MLDSESLRSVREAVQQRAEADKVLLDRLRAEARVLVHEVREIRPRSVTAMSVVAADGGNNRLEFDPYVMQLVRVVDSYGRQLFLDVISASTDTDELSDAQFKPDGSPETPLGYLMHDLGVHRLYHLSHMVPKPNRPIGEEVNPSWVMVYRDLCEWAVLYRQICNTSFATDTLIVRDGLLRSKLFSKQLFAAMCCKMEEAIARIHREDKRRVFLVGVAKSSKVLTRYQLAMSIERIMLEDYPCYVHIPRDLEQRAFTWKEWAVAEDEGSAGPIFVAGTLHFVKFGNSRHDQIWPVDILNSQVDHTPVVLGCLLADAKEGFPVPHQPRCLQKAHEGAALTGLDMAILQDEIFRAIRRTLPQNRQDVLDAFRLRKDGSDLRYG